MNGRINSVMTRMVMLFASVVALAPYAAAQAINIDLDIGIGDPELGNGAPSSSFGGAAAQAGFWNRIGFGSPPLHLQNTLGQITSAVLSAESSGSFGGIGFRNETNTGDFALLLNDAAQVATLSSGGFLTYNFTGLGAGPYLIYTYSVHPAGHSVDAPVYVKQASQNQTQTVTGPMPGNSFEYLVTHSVHEVAVGPDGFSVHIVQPPNIDNSMYVNGFQIVPVPEPNSINTIVILCSLLFIRKRAVIRP